MREDIHHEILRYPKDLIKNNPRFRDATKLHYAINDMLYKKQPLFYKVILQEPRFVIVLTMCCLVFGSQASCVSEVKEFCLRYKISSPNSVISLITLLKTTNRIRTWRSQDDRRKVLIEPTQKGIDELRRYLNGAFEPLNMLFPQQNISVCLLDNDTYRHKFFARVAEYLFGGVTFKNILPDVGLFIDKDGGRMLMLHLYLHSVDEMNSQLAVIKYSASVLSKEFSISRTHINQIIHSVQEAGYLCRREDGMLEIYPSFIQLVEDYIGLYFAYAAHYLGINIDK